MKEGSFPMTDQPRPETTEISGITLDHLSLGAGRPLLFLHGIEGPTSLGDRHLRALAAHHRVLVPWHPGFGARERPGSFRDIADLAYLYLDWAAALDLRDAVLVGASFGGWVAAEMMVRETSRFSHVVLSAPLGIKIGGIGDRDIADFFALTEEEFTGLAFADPARGQRDLGALDDAALTAHFRSHEAFAFYGWQPYMHNPQLRRWLHRVRRPTLVVAGAADRFVRPGYHAAFAAGIPGARLATLEQAGHFPHLERPEEFARLVLAHAAAPAAADAA